MAIYEDGKSIFATDLEEIEWILKTFGNNKMGINSTIYHYKDVLLKVYNEARDIDELKELEKLNRLKTKTLIKTIKTLLVNGYFYGYSMPKLDGKMLAYISNKTNLNRLLESLEEVEKDMILLGKNHFFSNDLNTLGIIYNKATNKSSVIDLESYVFQKEESSERIIMYNLITLYRVVFFVLSNIYCHPKKPLVFYSEVLNKIVMDIEHTQNIREFYTSIIEDLENVVDREINTLYDFRKLLKLSKNYEGRIKVAMF